MFCRRCICRDRQKNSGKHETHFDRWQRDPEAAGVFHPDSVTDCQNEENQHRRPKEQTEDDEDAADATEKRHEKAPDLKVRMNSNVARARSKMGPGGWSAD